MPFSQDVFTHLLLMVLLPKIIRKTKKKFSENFLTTNHLDDLGIPFGRKGVGFGLDFGVVLNPGDVGEVSTAGEYNWGGAAGTRFWIDPQENLIGLFMVQSIPHRTRLAGDFKVLAYGAMTETQVDD